MKIYPSLISADLLNLASVITTFDGHCDGYHIDIMDGHFVPNITWGPIFSNAVASKTQTSLHIHLMVSDPSTVADKLAVRPDDMIIFHYEATKQPSALTTLIKEKGCKVGVALNPDTPVNVITNYLPQLDEVLLMSVWPGASGQAFITKVADKIQELVILKKKQNPTMNICLDGGVGTDNIKDLATKGADSFAVASAIFATADPLEALKKLYS